ncbi:MAG: membrane protein insertase YidC [Rubellimicrobium sp.]|nr:membrane protein insertase YidC [Rubellimicrobium sp.]
MEDQTKNLILATVLSFVVILTWVFLFPPEAPPQTDAPVAATDAQETAPATAGTPPTADTSEAPVEIATEVTRLPVETPNLTGSITLQGGRIDDLELVNYRETLDDDSPFVRMLSPLGQPEAYYALYGWAAGAGISADLVPGPNTLWEIESGTTLTPETPVTLVWNNGEGLVFRRKISVDPLFMFTVDQSVENTGDTPVTLAPYAIVARHGSPPSAGFFILHEGVVRMSDGRLQEITYRRMRDLDPDPRRSGLSDVIEVTENGWIGFTDKYWMTTIVPQPGTPFRSTAHYNPAAGILQTEALFPSHTVAPGQTVSNQSQLFAGAKEWTAIRDYQSAGIDRFIDSIDWGWFFFLTKPIFWLLHQINGTIGNMGWSIIVLTLVIKALVLPLAYKSYVSMARMKELQPEMEKLKEQAGDDRQALQTGMMKLYRDNKVNPASGCLPILIQIPIFFSLYKVIFVTIELRHAPWIWWIEDLSAPDPSSILNLFGLLPWGTPDATSLFFILSLGILPIFLGISMWLQQKLNPTPTDPTQKMVFAWLPWIFMFMLGSFASGLVLYWIANNVITFLQQYVIMRRHGHKPDVFGNILAGFKRTPKTANTDGKPGGKG